MLDGLLDEAQFPARIKKRELVHHLSKWDDMSLRALCKYVKGDRGEVEVFILASKPVLFAVFVYVVSVLGYMSQMPTVVPCGLALFSHRIIFLCHNYPSLP